MTTDSKPSTAPGAAAKPAPKGRSSLPAAFILLLLGWSGLYAIINFTLPNGGTRWAFFFFCVLALTGLALPVTSYLNRRFPSIPPATSFVILRQAIWFGIYVPTLLWLRIGRVVSLSLALLLAAGLILIEWLLRLRERSQWRPERGG
jgi:hypothetical protein